MWARSPRCARETRGGGGGVGGDETDRRGSWVNGRGRVRGRATTLTSGALHAERERDREGGARGHARVG
jgi:hypothetical protein